MQQRGKTNLVIAVIGILIFCDFLLPLLAEINTDAGEASQNLGYKIFAIMVYMGSFYMIFTEKKRFQRILKQNQILLLLVSIALISILWSVNPSATFQKSIGLLGTTLFGVFLYLKLDFPEFIRVLILSFLGIGVVSLSLFFLFPEISIHQTGVHEGLWRGAFTHKNIMARIMTLAVVLSIIDIFENFTKLTKVLNLITVALCGVLLLMSGGKSGILITVFLLMIIYPILKFISKATQKQKVIVYSTLFFIGVICLVLIIIIYKNAQAIVGIVGGDLTLTGRTILWGMVVIEALERPLLGFGFGAFWESDQVFKIWNMAGWEPPHAHNGFLDLWLDLGLIGLSLFLILMIRYIKNGFQRLPDKDGKGILLLIIVFYLILYAVPGNTIVSQNSLSWFLFVYVMLYASNYRSRFKYFEKMHFKIKRVE